MVPFLGAICHLAGPPGVFLVAIEYMMTLRMRVPAKIL